MTKSEKILLSSLRENPINPRTISDAKFEKLCNSITEYPNLLTVNKLKVDFSNDNIILGGNMRFKALLALGYKEIPLEWIEDCSGLKNDEKQALIPLDNSNYGEWDYELLKEHFDTEILEIADIELPVESEPQDYSSKNNEIDVYNFDEKMMLKFLLDKERFNFVNQKLIELSDVFEVETKEDVLVYLLEKYAENERA